MDSDDEEFLKAHGTIFESEENFSKMDVSEGGRATDIVKEGQITVTAFEWMLQWLERRAFLAAQSLENLQSKNAAQFDDTPCTVCRRKDSNDVNQIVICDGCDVAVHQECYGIGPLPDGAWMCDPCSDNLKPRDIACEFCFAIGGGIFKPIVNVSKNASTAKEIGPAVPVGYKHRKSRSSSEKTWGHVQCAKWVHGASIDTKKIGSKIIYKAPHPSKLAQRLPQCDICSRNKGMTTKCSDSRCSRHFHVLCAQKKALVLCVDSRGRHLAYCDSHTPSKLYSFRKEQQKTRESEKIAKRRIRKMEQNSNFASRIRTSSRRTDITTPLALKYCAGIAAEPTMTEASRDWTARVLRLPYRDEISLKLFSGKNAPILHSIFNHWMNKRVKSKGLPLLKAFHPSLISNSGAMLINSMDGTKEMERAYQKLLQVREYLALMRSLADKLVQREKMKHLALLAKRKLCENVLYSERTSFGAQIHIATVVATEVDEKSLFLHSATLDHPYDWITILDNVRRGKYAHDEEKEGGGSFFEDLLSAVDPSKVPAHLSEEATLVREKLLLLQLGHVSEAGIKRKPHPLSIILPVKAVDEVKKALQAMQHSGYYRSIL